MAPRLLPLAGVGTAQRAPRPALRGAAPLGCQQAPHWARVGGLAAPTKRASAGQSRVKPLGSAVQLPRPTRPAPGSQPPVALARAQRGPRVCVTPALATRLDAAVETDAGRPSPALGRTAPLSWTLRRCLHIRRPPIPSNPHLSTVQRAPCAVGDSGGLSPPASYRPRRGPDRPDGGGTACPEQGLCTAPPEAGRTLGAVHTRLRCCSSAAPGRVPILSPAEHAAAGLSGRGRQRVFDGIDCSIREGLRGIRAKPWPAGGFRGRPPLPPSKAGLSGAPPTTEGVGQRRPQPLSSSQRRRTSNTWLQT